MHLQAKNTLKNNFEKQFSIWLKKKEQVCAAHSLASNRCPCSLDDAS